MGAAAFEMGVVAFETGVQYRGYGVGLTLDGLDETRVKGFILSQRDLELPGGEVNP